MTSASLGSSLPAIAPASSTPRVAGQKSGGFRDALEMPGARPADTAGDRPLNRDTLAAALAMALDGALVRRNTAEPGMETPRLAVEEEGADEELPRDAAGDDRPNTIDDDPTPEIIPQRPLRTELPPAAGAAFGPATTGRPEASETVGAEPEPIRFVVPPAPPKSTVAGAAVVQAPKSAQEPVAASPETVERPKATATESKPAKAGGVDGNKAISQPDAPFRQDAIAPLQDDGESAQPAKPVVGAVVSGQQSFVAPQASPAATVAAALGADAAWSSYFRETVATGQAAGGVRSLKIQLHPAELGMVTAHLRVSGDTMTVELQAETDHARRQLAADSDQIVRSLRALGMDIDKVTVQPARQEEATQREPGSSTAGNARAGSDQAGGSSTGQHARSREGDRDNPAMGDDSRNGQGAAARDIPAGDARYI